MRILLVLFGIFVFCGCSPDKQAQIPQPAPPQPQNAPTNPLVVTNLPIATKPPEPRDDPALNEAIAKAKATSGDFLRAFREKPPGTKSFFVKKPYPTPSGGAEHMWISVLEETNGALKGKIANDADETREVKMGQIVSFDISDISDWKYTDGKKLVGGFTIRYYFDKMSPQEKADFLKQSGFEM